jgi:hypothetical protein
MYLDTDIFVFKIDRLDPGFAYQDLEFIEKIGFAGSS